METLKKYYLSILIVAVSVVAAFWLIYLFLHERLTLGYAPEWSWGHQNIGINHQHFALYILLLIFFLIFGYLALTPNKINRRLFLLATYLFSIFIFFGSFAIDNKGIHFAQKIIEHRGATSYFTDATRIDNLKPFLTNYQDNIGNLEMHSQVHPPAPIVFFYSVIMSTSWVNRHFGTNFSDALISAIILILTSGATIFAVYFLANNLANEPVARTATLFYAVLPASILFSPGFDAVYPLYYSSILLLFLLGIKQKNHYYFLLAGLVLAFSLFFSYLFLTIIIPLAILTLYYRHQFKLTLWIRNLGVFGLGFIAFNFIYWLIFHSSILPIYKATIPIHYSFLATKTYSIWLIYNIYDFFTFIGLPLAILILFFTFCQIARLINTKKIPGIAFWIFILTILAIDLVGKNRSEVARLWLFLTPLATISGASFINQKKIGRLATLALITIIFIQLIYFKKYVITIGLS